MKNNYYKYLLMLFIVFISKEIYAQVDVSKLTGKKWKLDQFYGNKIRYNNPQSDSERHEYMSDGTFRISRIDNKIYATMNYALKNDSLIFLVNGVVKLRYKITYLNANCLIYTGFHIDNTTNKKVITEFRYIPQK